MLRPRWESRKEASEALGARDVALVVALASAASSKERYDKAEAELKVLRDRQADKARQHETQEEELMA